MGEHEKASAIAVDQRQGEVVTVQPPILHAVSMCVPDDTGEVGSATGSLTASAERTKYADCVKIPYAQQPRDDAQQPCIDTQQPRDDAQLTGERDSRWTLVQSKRQRHQKSRIGSARS